MGLRDQILAAEDLRHEDIEVPEWGGIKIRLREMTAAQRTAMQEQLKAIEGKPPFEAWVHAVALTVVNQATDPESGEYVFAEGDVEELKRKSWVVLKRIGNQASALNGSRSVEEATKNS